MSTTATKPTTCDICRRLIDWSGADHHRGPGSLEDGIVLCRDCVFHIDPSQAA